MIWQAMFGNGAKIGMATGNNTRYYEEVLGTLTLATYVLLIVPTAIRIIVGIANLDSAVCQNFRTVGPLISAHAWHGLTAFTTCWP